jgi:O-acetylserine/cysteine efflux transporter
MIAKTSHLPLTHILLAIAVTAVWGSNFVVIKIGLGDLPPLFFAALRYCLVIFPWIFFIRRPPVLWWHLAAYGILIGVGQIGLMYIALRHDISPGLASVILPTNAFFTIGLSMWIRRESIHPFQIFALSLAATGLCVILMHGGYDATVLGVILTLLAAFSWAVANVIAKSDAHVNMLAYVVWSSLFAIPPLFLFSFLFDGWPSIQTGLSHASLWTWVAVLHQSLSNTMFGYGVWAWLLARHPAASITPFSLMAPVFGMSSSAIFLSESLPSWKLLAAALVLSGLILNLIWSRLGLYLTRQATS